MLSSTVASIIHCYHLISSNIYERAVSVMLYWIKVQNKSSKQREKQLTLMVGVKAGLYLDLFVKAVVSC